MKEFLNAKWENLIMANYAVDPLILEPYLPNGVELDFYEGKTYLSLVGFMFVDTSIFKIPIPFLGTFAEVNLRFYVLRKTGNELRRGVVFINETVPYKMVAFLANRLYKEHYSAVPTKNSLRINSKSKHIEYKWKVNEYWNCISVEAELEKKEIEKNSFEEYIFEHYYGYTKLTDSLTEEYRIYHPSWETNRVVDFNTNCIFSKTYGDNFSFLETNKPASVFVAEGSLVSVAWNRIRF